MSAITSSAVWKNIFRSLPDKWRSFPPRWVRTTMPRLGRWCWLRKTIWLRRNTDGTWQNNLWTSVSSSCAKKSVVPNRFTSSYTRKSYRKLSQVCLLHLKQQLSRSMCDQTATTRACLTSCGWLRRNCRGSAHHTAAGRQTSTTSSGCTSYKTKVWTGGGLSRKSHPCSRWKRFKHSKLTTTSAWRCRHFKLKNETFCRNYGRTRLRNSRQRPKRKSSKTNHSNQSPEPRRPARRISTRLEHLKSAGQCRRKTSFLTNYGSSTNN